MNSRTNGTEISPGTILSFLINIYRNNHGIFFLISIWILSVIVVNPKGEFPLNDDWIYLQTLQHLYFNHAWIFSDWISSTLVSQILWALFFCKILGYTIFVVRVSTLVTTFFIIAVFYVLLNKLTRDKKLSLLATAVFIFNPVLYVQSFTFMTEASFNLAMILCASASLVFFLDNKIKAILFATMFGCIAVLIKQPGLIIASVLPLVILINRPLNKLRLLFSILSAGIVILTYMLFLSWLNSKFANPEHVNGVNQKLIENIKAGTHDFFLHQRQMMVIIFMYVGVFLLPMLPIFLITAPKIILSFKNKLRVAFPFLSGNSRKLFSYINYVLIIIVILFSYSFTKQNPVGSIENVLYNFGLGPLLFHDTFLLKINLESLEIPSYLFRWVSFIGLLLAVLLIVFFIIYFALTLRKSFAATATPKDKFFQLLFISGVTYIFLLTNVYLFDRYILVLVPITLMMLFIIIAETVETIKLKYYIVSFSMVAFFLVFEVLATHDYLEWNRAKWKALNHLTNDLKISPKEMDGGYEFNGMHNYNVNYVKSENKSWWWVQDDKYMLTMGALPGYSEYFKMPYHSWLSRREKYIFVLRRE